MLNSVKRRPLCSTKKLIQARVLLDRLSTAARIRDAREAARTLGHTLVLFLLIESRFGLDFLPFASFTNGD